MFNVATFHGVTGPYLTVYSLFHTKKFSVCVHKFHRGDEDLDCHDHPFDFWSLVLSGGYKEFAQDLSFVVRRFGSFCYRTSAHRHRVELLTKSCWTLVVKRYVNREWGFWRGEVFVPWRQYILEKGLEPIEKGRVNDI